ncbi:hypothetical protein LR69_01464 [Geobacillus sp. BCO2]|nr:hypothetical protein LR69_01464 [Geobacillus sp. BCO2]
MTLNYKIEILETVVAPGKGSIAYEIGYYTGKVVSWIVTFGGLFDKLKTVFYAYIAMFASFSV